MANLEAEDIRILQTLQENGRMTNAELSETVGMSASPCWRRVRRLETKGVIQGYTARLNRRALGLGVLAYVSVEIDNHTVALTRQFEVAVAGLDEVIACHQVTGGADYILTVVSRDLDSYADFANTRLRPIAGIKAISTSFVLKEAKAQGGLPV